MLVVVTRLWNEDDIIEAFVRHHAVLVDQFVFLDNASSDRTLDILRSLSDEGIRITVFATPSLTFDEANTNTWLYRYASDELHADWVLFLDADEFIDSRAVPEWRRARPGWLAELLAAIPAKTETARVLLANYAATAIDDAAELIVPVRLRWRIRDQPDVQKVFARGGLRYVSVEPGNHNLRVGIVWPEPENVPLVLAHYPRRSEAQWIGKAAIGWLKVLAAGQGREAAGVNSHYRGPFDLLRDRPVHFAHSFGAPERPVDAAALVELPLAYLGGSLRHTEKQEPTMRAVTMGLRYVEALARQHGRLLDELGMVRETVARWNAARDPVLIPPAPEPPPAPPPAPPLAPPPAPIVRPSWDVTSAGA